MATVQNPQEIEVDVLPPTGDRVNLYGSQERELRKTDHLHSFNSFLKSLTLQSVLKYLTVFLLVIVAVVAYTLTHVKQSSTVDSLAALASKKEMVKLYDIQLNTGSKLAFHDCGKVRLKQTFPNIGFALSGYNVIKGFPLTSGHDPGFTYPIFAAHFTSRASSSDCRFFVPDGLLVNPDMTCFLSLSSETIQSQYEYSRFLQTYTSIEDEHYSGRKIGGSDDNVKENTPQSNNTVNSWGISFSASAGYKESSFGISSGTFVYVFSTAKCKYYFSKLVHENAPPFDKAFLKLINKLDQATNPDLELYFKLFETYGTHFATEVTLGARYTFKHKMPSEYYRRLKGNGIDVNALADYAGAKLLEEDVSLSSTLQKYAVEFVENVETTIIPVGIGPKENGTALSWASDVQLNPLPTEYKLTSIEDLFTGTYMKHLNINYQRIRGNIIKLKSQYCSYLRDRGDVESCTNLGAGVVLQNTKLLKHYKEHGISSISGCIEKCLQDVDCEATTYCLSCQRKDSGYKKCYFLKGTSNSISAEKTEVSSTVWESNIFQVKIKTQLKVADVAVIGSEIEMANEDDKRADLARCKQLCLAEAYCTVYSFTDHQGITTRCKLYNKKQVLALQKTVGMDTFFLPA